VADPRPALRSVPPEALYREPNSLAHEYSAFDVGRRLLLTGHSHQAWPDCARAGVERAWDDAARYVDGKWARAEAAAERVRAGFARLLGDSPERIALGANTHELLVRFLSALPLRERPRLVTTDGEFHSLRRQLARLAEEGVEVQRVPTARAGDIAPRLAAALDGRTAAVLVSAVLYADARIVPGLGELARACESMGVPLWVDAYHALNAVPFELETQGLGSAYAAGGGYKYCQLGEGCAFLRLPPGCALRPVITGWFAEPSGLESEEPPAVGYPDGPLRFAGATYDPTSHYRAAEVFDFFAERGLTPGLLREVSQHQVGLLAAGFDALDLDPRRIDRDRSLPLPALGGFLALRSAHAARLVAELHERGVHADARGPLLRLGPAPYLCDRQLRDALTALREACDHVDLRR
jgi:selenocysteine lyase/cysteine desulfurase